MFSIVIPSCNQANLDACIQAIRLHEPDSQSYQIIVVDDGVSYPGSIQGKKPFVFARNVNLGIKAADSDVILMNDDALLQTPNGFTNLHQHGRGIVSASIKGVVGNPRQLHTPSRGFRREHGVLCFVCVLIPKSVQEAIGLLDERFDGYGFEDNDYCCRAHKAGIPLWTYDGCVVEHESLTPTFRSQGNWVSEMHRAQDIFRQKYA